MANSCPLAPSSPVRSSRILTSWICAMSACPFPVVVPLSDDRLVVVCALLLAVVLIPAAYGERDADDHEECDEKYPHRTERLDVVLFAVLRVIFGHAAPFPSVRWIGGGTPAPAPR